MRLKTFLRSAYKKLKNQQKESQRAQLIKSYIEGGRKPWTAGYELVKNELIIQALNDVAMVEKFKQSCDLPPKYGEFIDERIVEYPWFISRVNSHSGYLLDAGSALNFEYILLHRMLQNKNISIVTLEPETTCLWKHRINYLFADLRNLPFRDNWFDEVVSISTIEHIGMDNSIYSSDSQWKERKSSDFLKAVIELRRVTKLGGKVYITVPYGKYTDFGWYQQFNADMIQKIIKEFKPSKKTETYFKYENGGWQFSDSGSCQSCEGFNIHDTKYFNPKSKKGYS